MSVTAGTPRGKALAAALRAAREAAGLGLRELARRLEIRHATLSNWETGKRVPRPEDVASVLTAIGIDGQDQERIIELARHASEPNWLTAGIPGVSQQLAGAMECESTATTITEWEPLVIPGLLQTSDYARAIIASGEMSRSEVEALVHVRIGRRDVLTRRNPVHLVALIGEAAILDYIGSDEIMADQLRHLLRMASLDTVDVQVVPSGVGWHPGRMGPFVLFDFADAPSIVHLEHHRSGVFLSDVKDVKAYRTAADTVRRVAMSPEESAKFVADVITTFGATT
jgi:hypothetical protein